MTYVVYEDQRSIDGLDINTIPAGMASEFPRNFYSKEPFQTAYYVVDYPGPRDRQINYLYRDEVHSHPDNFSRFGYAECWNGYCSGHWPGRYNTPDMYKSCTDAQPLNMAPEKYYHGDYQSPFYASSPAYNRSKRARARMDVR